MIEKILGDGDMMGVVCCGNRDIVLKISNTNEEF
jgi:hypothetical protein